MGRRAGSYTCSAPGLCTPSFFKLWIPRAALLVTDEENWGPLIPVALIDGRRTRHHALVEIRVLWEGAPRLGAFTGGPRPRALNVVHSLAKIPWTEIQ